MRREFYARQALKVSGMALVLALASCSRSADEPSSNASSSDFILGQVESSSGHPEAGVWVIAETNDLATPFRKIVVTDDNGKFALPELPEAEYEIWVRGYGLSDSDKVSAKPGDTISVAAKIAESAEDAAQIYPASYWLSMFEPVGESAGWTSSFKLGCQLCHQVGSQATRLFDSSGYDLGVKKATHMNAVADHLGREDLLAALDDWAGRIRDGQTPEAPPRPAGIERNFVITQWEWGDGFTYAHDEIATDKRDPSLYPNGPIYGVDLANDNLLVLDPATHAASAVKVPTLSGFDTPWCNQTYQGAMMGNADIVMPMGFGSLGCEAEEGVSGFVGKYANPANPHNPMMDREGRVWMTTQIRREWDEDLPEFCKDAPGISGLYHHRQLGYYDTRSGQTQLIDTCYGTHHLQLDEQGVLWLSGDVFVIGWFDPSKYDPGKPETLEAAQGWAVPMVDTDGDGVADLQLVGFNYGVIPNPVDKSVWTAQPGGNPGDAFDFRGRLVRYEPSTGKFETYRPPKPGSGPRGVDVDSQGIIWASLGGSGHLGKFDRSKCAQTWGAGEQCPEGWTVYRSPGPLMKTGEGPENETGADFHYYLFVDQHNTLGLGNDIVVMNGTGSDSLLAFDPKTETFTTVRVPYPLNTYTRGLDGRIDDAEAGWKGRALWYTNGLDPLLHSEVPRSYVGKVQMRPDPLAH